ncbi:sex peptide receptor-like [Vespa mandarinia]|uniref:sex peptide receptor-like n=1 Tax=Vespa mandarinia TaxID=7446 RepID=UPI001618E2B0|nr:sex peptide receptor-like [Vespa mandarinia]XP_035732206.1 sex peptide receptor-like [Vespa mandarinia]XP_035732207.1 sex peptide receptor-like [Vespa mandarinia]XP_035732208.1 sex peptide receptor-like [Vespa mandarinia]XP_035732209.1 sex peptide receptor-like [Vespa mandarinia]XP_035732210.1 sex peptide receptor-like [Vespa mandarinia]
MHTLENYIEIFLKLNLTLEDLKILENYTGPWSDIWSTDCYCNGSIRDWALTYRKYHGYVAIMVCIFGTFANMLNIVVLTHKEMMVTPINKILTGLALADMLVMLEYIPFAIYIYLILPRHRNFSYGWAVFVLFHMHFAQIFHTISIALTLTLAVWRYIALRFLQYNHAWCTPTRCKIALWCCVLAPLIACAPSYFVFGIKDKHFMENGTSEIWYYVDTDYSTDKGFIYQLNFWILGVVVKLMPCVILTIISCWLIKTLCRTKDRKQALKNYNQPLVKNLPINNSPIIPRRPSKNEKHADRTTRMLVAVLLLFLITEIPQGVLGLLSGILGDCFFHSCYHTFGEVMDILALLNGAINFILYCLMSRQFRISFERLFKPKIMKKCQPTTQQTDVQTTYV